MKRALLAMALLACTADVAPADPEPIPPLRRDIEPKRWRLVLDRNMSEGDIDHFVHAARAWEFGLATSCPLTVAIELGEPSDQIPNEEQTIVARVGGLKNPSLEGWTSWGSVGTGRGAWVIVRPPVDQTTVRHELGHAFKLDHHPVPGVLALPSSERIEPRDVASYALLHCNVPKQRP